jgi:hypothetical protein
MTTNEETTKQTTTTRRISAGRRIPEPITVSDPEVADSLNKKTVGIRQLSDVYDLQRLKKQNALNRELVARAQVGLAQATTDAITNGANMADSNEAEDKITIGDSQTTHINVGDPAQLQAILDHLNGTKGTTTPQQPEQPPVDPGPTGPTGPVNTITTPPGVSVNVNPQEPQGQPQLPQQPPQQPPPREKTFGEKLLPWALLGTMALAAGGIGYALKPTPDSKDTNTQYELQFDPASDTTTTPGNAPGVIPTPSLKE